MARSSSGRNKRVDHRISPRSFSRSASCSRRGTSCMVSSVRSRIPRLHSGPSRMKSRSSFVLEQEITRCPIARRHTAIRKHGLCGSPLSSITGGPFACNSLLEGIVITFGETRTLRRYYRMRHICATYALTIVTACAYIRLT